MKRLLKPITPKPTTPIPITEPPVKATSIALPKEFLAALVVLTLAFVATRMPINPARAEQMAPTTNDMATIPWDPSSLLPLMYNSTAKQTTKIDNILYSALRKDMAPFEILLAMVAIFSFPTSCLAIQLFLMKTNVKPKNPNAGKNSITNFMY